jgi:hypothetical protein
VITELSPYQLYPITEHEAREHTDAVKYHLNEAGRHLLIMRESEGWRALGYQSWTQYLEREFVQCRSHLYDLMNSFPVVERLQQSGYTPNTAQALALAKLPEVIQVITYEMASKRQGGATADRIEAIGEILTEALNTGGYVTTKDGSQTAIENAINSLRTEQEIGKRPASILDTKVDVDHRADGDYITLKLPASLAAHVRGVHKVRIVVYPEAA